MPLDCKVNTKTSKYYSWETDSESFVVAYRVNGKQLKFGRFKIEEEAQARVEYIKSLSKEDLIDYYHSNLLYKNVFKVSRDFKGYEFDKQRGKFRVRFALGGSKVKCYGQFLTETEAQEKVMEVLSKGGASR
jgi:hypothetical protein